MNIREWFNYPRLRKINKRKKELLQPTIDVNKQDF